MTFNSTHTPSSITELIHSVPRFGMTNEYTEAEEDDYLKGVLFNAAVVAAVGLLCWLVTILMYFCACCRNRCGCYKSRGGPAVGPAPRCKGFAGFLVMVVLGAVVLTYGLQTASDGVDSVADAAGKAGDLSDALTLATNQLKNQVDVSQDLVEELLDEAGSSYTTALEAIEAALAQTEADAATVLSKAADAKADTTSFKNDANNVSSQGLDSGVMVAFLFAAWAVLTLVAASCKWSSCRCILKFLLFLGILLLGVVYMLLAGWYAGVLVVGDTCMDPEATTLDLSGVGLGTTFAADDTSVDASLHYYLYCGAENPNLQRTGAILTIDDVRAAVAESSSLVDSLPASSDPEVNEDIQDLKTSIATQTSIVNIALAVGECDSVQGVWLTARDGVCSDGVDGTSTALVGLLLVWVFLQLSLWKGVKLWIRHPKQKPAQPGHGVANLPLPMADEEAALVGTPILGAPPVLHQHSPSNSSSNNNGSNNGSGNRRTSPHNGGSGHAVITVAPAGTSPPSHHHEDDPKAIEMTQTYPPAAASAPPSHYVSASTPTAPVAADMPPPAAYPSAHLAATPSAPPSSSSGPAGLYTPSRASPSASPPSPVVPQQPVASYVPKHTLYPTIT